MTVTDDRELWDDPDLLDFEDPTKRHLIAARQRKVRVPATVSAARWTMFLQPLLPILVPLIMIGTRAGTGTTDETAPVTTTTVASNTAETTTQGRAGGFLMVAVVFLALLVLLVVVAARLPRLTSGSRVAALLLEGVVLVAGGAMLSRGISPLAVALAGSSAIVIGLLLSPSSRRAIGSNVGDTAARFDIRNLPTLEP